MDGECVVEFKEDSPGIAEGECGRTGEMEGEVPESISFDSQQTVKPTQLLDMIQRQSYRCALSGVVLVPKESALDHKHPVSRGGNHTIENLQWLDPQVNRAKGTLTNGEFIELCKRVAQWTA